MKKDFRTLDRKALDTVAGGANQWSSWSGTQQGTQQNWNWNNQWKW
jgi:hypothetical protein